MAEMIGVEARAIDEVILPCLERLFDDRGVVAESGEAAR